MSVVKILEKLSYNCCDVDSRVLEEVGVLCCQNRQLHLFGYLLVRDEKTFFQSKLIYHPAVMSVDVGDNIRLILLKFFYTWEIHGIAEDYTNSTPQDDCNQQECPVGQPEKIMTTPILI